jgi:hypothetical protein
MQPAVSGRQVLERKIADAQQRLGEAMLKAPRDQWEIQSLSDDVRVAELELIGWHAAAKRAKELAAEEERKRLLEGRRQAVEHSKSADLRSQAAARRAMKAARELKKATDEMRVAARELMLNPRYFGRETLEDFAAALPRIGVVLHSLRVAAGFEESSQGTPDPITYLSGQYGNALRILNHLRGEEVRWFADPKAEEVQSKEMSAASEAVA